MLLPVGPGRISSGFFDPQYPRTEHRQHLGADFLAPTGSPVYAPVEGDIVVNNTAASDVMDAYLVIRSGGGVEHVLGHIASGLSARSHVKAGQQVGTIRPWPGQPNRSHVHWGVNRFGVLQAMRGGWGWGRAPEQATRAEAEARGWTAP
jgi:murein DD-endopeptidase MepM/ murein hydrolase activator NlpD